MDYLNKIEESSYKQKNKLFTQITEDISILMDSEWSAFW